MIRYVLFDLDNTLYSASYGLEDAVVRRINRFVADLMGVDETEASTLRYSKGPGYGTTLEWLIAEHGISDPDAYYAAVHPDDEVDTLMPDPTIVAFVRNLPVPSSVLTNSPMEHADRVLRRIGLRDAFEHIFDIRWNGLEGKPSPAAYRKALDRVGLPPEEVLFVDDSPIYVEGYRKLGGTAVLIDEEDAYSDIPGPRIRALPELAAFIPGAAQ